MNALPPFETTTHSPEETEQLGEALAGLLPPGTVVALYGDLAAGKTCLVRGMARRDAAGEPVHSPTFTLVNEYGTEGRFHHLDLYRLSCADELADIGYEDLFDGDGICAVEWAERAEGLLPMRHVAVHLEHAGGDQRRIVIEDNGLLPENWRERLASAKER
jgi:tRNA threonylcarbamoyladenosine biosynthesis protein TsaE